VPGLDQGLIGECPSVILGKPGEKCKSETTHLHGCKVQQCCQMRV
jgi:hypothetical protein